MLCRLFILFLCGSSSCLIAETKAVVFSLERNFLQQRDDSFARFISDSLGITQDRYAKEEAKRHLPEFSLGEIAFWKKYADEQWIFLEQDWGKKAKSSLLAALPWDCALVELIELLNAKPLPTCFFTNISLKDSLTYDELGLKEICTSNFVFQTEEEVPSDRAFTILLESLDLYPEEVFFFSRSPQVIKRARQLGFDAVLFSSVEQIRYQLAVRNVFVSLLFTSSDLE